MIPCVSKKKAKQQADKALRRFRRTAAQGFSYFYNVLNKWMSTHDKGTKASDG